MATDVRVRLQDDLPSCAQALVEVHRSDGYPVEGVADPIGWLTPPTLIRAWVAEKDGSIVGHVLLTTPQEGDDAARLWQSQSANDEKIAVLGRLFVLSTARGHSFGEHLMRAATEYAQQQNMRLVLDVMDKDKAAIRLYERLGWQRIGTAYHQFGEGQSIPAFCYVSPTPASS
ncbi:GNAT family N-acetyltransferase [Allokutzneria oryzae]|uniref:GNAT family N-acetyltransferase n=1 Tax=Allokutzneria oryzae TaxID=1378989 RepID=A0ABV6A4K6_9PSEU